MDRDPSLHIKRSDLIKLIEEELNEYIYATPASRKKEIMVKIVDNIMERGKIKSCSSRAILANNAKTMDKATKIQLASRSDAGLFAQSLLLIRRKLKHKGITLIHPADPEWLIIKDITKNATEFCNEFQIEPKLGYREYIEIGMGLMSSFGLNRFKSLHPQICNRYDSIQEISLDKNPNRTVHAHGIFCRNVIAKTGYASGYEGSPEKYRYFVRAASEDKKIGIPIDVYIKAQFAAFEWNNSIPEPTQIAGEKARERVMKYCYENKISLNKEYALENGSNINFRLIKKNGKTKNHNK